MDIDRDSAGVRFPPPLLFVGALVVGWAAGRLIGQPGVPLHNWGLVRDLGWIAIVAGFAIMLSANGLFRKAGTDVKPWKAATTLVTDGVYRWTRNPMYLGMSLAYLGFAIVLDSLLALILFVPVFVIVTREVIEREEAYLTARFGDAYRDYRANVRRWV